MAAARVPYTLRIKGGSSMIGEVVVENLSKSDASDPETNIIRVTLDSNQLANVNVQNMRSAVSNGDILEIRMNGVRSGNLAHTVNTKQGHARINLSQTGSDYAGASISL